MYKGAETWAQTGHGSGGQVQLDLVRAAVLGCVTPAMSSIPLKSSGYSFHLRHINKYITLDL